jgi:hypothetical protein
MRRFRGPGEGDPRFDVCSLHAVRRLPAIAAASFITCASVGVGIQTTTSSASQPSAAAQLLSDALNAAQKAGSMQFVDKTTSNKSTQILEGVISAPTAGETLHSTEPLQINLINGLIYVYGSAGAIEAALQITVSQATPYADKWIVVHPSDAPFQLLAQDLTLAATIDDFTPGQRGLSMGKVQTVGHQKVIPVVGPPSDLPSGTSGSAALLVSTKAPHLPLGGTLILANKTGRLSEIAVFKAWGARVQLTAPTGTTAFSTVLG